MDGCYANSVQKDSYKPTNAARPRPWFREADRIAWDEERRARFIDGWRIRPAVAGMIPPDSEERRRLIDRAMGRGGAPRSKITWRR